MSISGIWLLGATVILSLFLVVLFFSKKNIKNFEVIIYKNMIILNFLFSLNVFIGYLIAKLYNIEFYINITQKVHLAFLLELSVLFFFYFVIINKFKEKTIGNISKITASILVIFIILILIFPTEVINYDDVVDLKGLSYYITLVGLSLSFILAVILNIRYYLKIEKNIKKNIPFIVLICLFICGFILRIFYPEIITESFCTTFVFLVMYHTIENPDVKMLNQLTFAFNQVEKSNRAKSDFLSSMSHELRTPLNTIIGLTENIKNYQEKLPNEIKGDINDILDSSYTLLEIISNVLDINKLENNEMYLIEKTYNINEEIDNISKLIKEKTNNKNLKFIKNINIISYYLVGDISKIKSIILNLLSNAIKYTDEGEIELNIKCLKIDNGTVNLIIKVRDTGIGIKGKNLKKLYDKFERLDVQINSATPGTGLGLAITKSLVEMLNGEIKVESEIGKGTTFTINIPQKIYINKTKDTDEEEIDTNTLKMSPKAAYYCFDSNTNEEYVIKNGKRYDLNKHNKK